MCQVRISAGTILTKFIAPFPSPSSQMSGRYFTSGHIFPAHYSRPSQTAGPPLPRTISTRGHFRHNSRTSGGVRAPALQTVHQSQIVISFDAIRMKGKMQCRVKTLWYRFCWQAKMNCQNVAVSDSQEIWNGVGGDLTLIVLMWRIGWAHNNARK